MDNICLNLSCSGDNCIGCYNYEIWCQDPRCYPNCSNCSNWPKDYVNGYPVATSNFNNNTFMNFNIGPVPPIIPVNPPLEKLETLKTDNIAMPIWIFFLILLFIIILLSVFSLLI